MNIINFIIKKVTEFFKLETILFMLNMFISLVLFKLIFKLNIFKKI